LEKQYYTRYKGKSSLWNARTIGEVWLEYHSREPRAPCPATLWKFDQLKGKIVLKKLRAEEIKFDGTLHIDGYYIKIGVFLP
jgi:hypothetical protein